MTFSRLDYKTTEKVGRANLDDDEHDNFDHGGHDFINKVKRSKTLHSKVEAKGKEMFPQLDPANSCETCSKAFSLTNDRQNKL